MTQNHIAKLDRKCFTRMVDGHQCSRSFKHSCMDFILHNYTAVIEWLILRTNGYAPSSVVSKVGYAYSRRMQSDTWGYAKGASQLVFSL
ncbi:hypothetical protein CEXT_481241 [Caerostris extrusa]|uniref:Uncharacterized protein n=1 Tax=Caerostris extrusa TaxID=172846 RepID=A0AAV4MAH2_CAEEX|nr:hypothetical protein CEXT_481241 [Caerostris extrusa]